MSELITTCPFCNKDKHFYINKKKKVYHCHRCKVSGRLEHLERQGFKIPLRIAERTQEPRSLVDAISTLPDHFPLSNISREYLINRGIDDLLLDSIPIYDTAQGILFIFPEERYWQIRRWEQFTPPRWENPHNSITSVRTGVTYLLDRHDVRTVVIVEGVCDALVVAPYANVAAVLSSSISPKQAMRLGGRFKKAIVLLDRDVKLSKRYNQAERITPYFETVRVVDPYEKENEQDPATLRRDTLREIARMCNY